MEKQNDTSFVIVPFCFISLHYIEALTFTYYYIQIMNIPIELSYNDFQSLTYSVLLAISFIMVLHQTFKSALVVLLYISCSIDRHCAFPWLPDCLND